jgi:hypothetical protein
MKMAKVQKKPSEPRRLLRAKSCFFIYCDDARKVAKLAHPTCTMAEISQIISAQWREMSVAEKQPYVELANQHREEFERTKVKTVATGSASQKLPPGWKRQIDPSTGVPRYVHGPSKTIMWSKPKADTVVPFVPKKSRTAFNYFVMRLRDCPPDDANADVPVAHQWKMVSATEAAECKRLAELDKQRYETEMELGQATKPEGLGSPERQG